MHPLLLIMVTQTLCLPLPATSTCSDSKPETITNSSSHANTGNTPPPFDPFHDLVPGYPKLAGRMGVMPEIAMFRRFGALNARNLLYMQNDLIDIENDLKELEAEDAKSVEGEKRFYRQNSIWLSTADFEIDDEPRDGDTRQRDLVMRMRTLLSEYSKRFLAICHILCTMC